MQVCGRNDSDHALCFRGRFRFEQGHVAHPHNLCILECPPGVILCFKNQGKTIQEGEHKQMGKQMSPKVLPPCHVVHATVTKNMSYMFSKSDSQLWVCNRLAAILTWAPTLWVNATPNLSMSTKELGCVRGLESQWESNPQSLCLKQEWYHYTIRSNLLTEPTQLHQLIRLEYYHLGRSSQIIQQQFIFYHRRPYSRVIMHLVVSICLSVQAALFELFHC